MPDSAYAAGAEWFERNEPILIRGLWHVRYGAPHTLSPTGLTRVGDFQGIPLFTLADDRWAGMIFVPVRPGCIFQAYEPPHRQG